MCRFSTTTSRADRRNFLHARCALILVATLACGCTSHQLRTAKRAGEITAASALFGILGTVVTAVLWDQYHRELLEGGAVFVPITLGGVGVYIAADSALGPDDTEEVPSHPPNWTAAMDLAKQAKHAAYRGDCAEVQAIEPRVRELDMGVYQRFLRDQVIRPCLGPQ
jgi:hypothetical protein